MAQTMLAVAIVAMIVMCHGVSAKRRPAARWVDDIVNVVDQASERTGKNGKNKGRPIPSSGCSAFGHSCFGGHGKRSGDTANIDLSGQELMARHQMGQEETPPHPGYPHYNALQPGDDIIPIRDGGMETNEQGVYDREDAGRDIMKFKLRNIFKHWMDNYRRSQQSDDGYFVENM